MHVQENYLPVVQGTSLAVQETTLTNEHPGENQTRQKLIVVSNHHSLTPKKTDLETISNSYRHYTYSFSGYLTANQIPLGAFIDIYA
jgi:hypothetical protein